MKIRGNVVGTPLRPDRVLVKATSLTEEEKAIARANIGAAKEDEVGVSSWNDLTDKPFYEEGGTEVLREYAEFGPFTSQSSYGGLFGRSEEPPGYELVLGETYVVTWDGVAYECVARDASATAEGALTLGNLTFADDGVGTGEPFLIAWIPEAVLYLSTDMVSPKTSYEIGITHDTTVVKTLDAKFLPMEAIDQRIDAYISEALGGDY